MGVLDIRVLKYFESVANKGSVSKAAEEHNIAQPALSKQIQLLESKIGWTLFKRSKKGMDLSDEGKLFLNLVRPLIRQFDQVIEYLDGINKGSHGNITVAIIPSMAGKIAEFFSQTWAETPNLHLTIREGMSSHAILYVLNSDAHLGITRLPINNPQIDYHILSEDPIQVYIKKDDPLANHSRILPEELANQNLYLIRSTLSNTGFSKVIQIFEENGIQPNVVAHVESSTTIFQLIKYGAGVGFATLSTSNIAPRELKAIPFGSKDIHAPLALIWRKDTQNPLTNQIKELLIKTKSLWI